MRKFLIPFVLFVIFSSINAFGKVGPDLRFLNQVPILKENIDKLFPVYKADTAWVVLIKSINGDIEKSKYHIDGKEIEINDFRGNIDVNYNFLKNQIAQKNVRYIRLLFKNSDGKSYKFIELDGDMTLEHEAVSLNDGYWEVNWKFKSGKIKRKLIYPELVSRESKTTGKKNEVFIWNLPALGTIKKNGLEEYFYESGNLRKSLYWENGVLKDTLAHIYYENGDPKTKVLLENGEVKSIERFDKSGNIIDEKSFTNPNKKAFLFGVGRFSDKYKIFKDINVENDIFGLKQALSFQGFEKDQIVSTQSYAETKEVKNLMELFRSSIEKDDIVFIHFSGHGIISEKDKKELKIPCSDSNHYSDINLSIEKGSLHQEELLSFVQDISRKSGSTGKVILSVDLSHAGYFLSMGIDPGTVFENMGLRGENAPILAAFSGVDNAPVVIFSGSKQDELSYETNINGITYGSLSYAMINGLSNPLNENIDELFESIIQTMSVHAPKQSPQYFGKENITLFENTTIGTRLAKTAIPPARLSGNAYVLSVGISNYNTSKAGYSFENTATDAETYEKFFSNEFNKLNLGNEYRLINKVLINEAATKENIITAINEAHDFLVNPQDYFVLNFSGFSKLLTDKSGKEETWFVPYGLKEITDDEEIRLKGIPLTQVRDLLQFINAENQLFITESGSSANFQREFVNSLMEISSNIGSFSSKNRFILVPNESGMDTFPCKESQIPNGPINHYITSLSEELNIFGLFGEEKTKNAVAYDLRKTEMECGTFLTDYFTIFSEAAFTRDIQHYLPSNITKMRGSEVINQRRAQVNSIIGKKYALVVGTNKYSDSNYWGQLGNPIDDAQAVGKVLEESYGFATTYLLDITTDQLMRELLRMNDILKENDQFIFFVAGHGDYDASIYDDGFLVCSNSLNPINDPYRNTYVPYARLSKMLNKMPTRQVLVILDVCFGGAFDEQLLVNQKKRSGPNMYDDLNMQEFTTSQLEKTTRKFISSGAVNEVPDGYKGRHSPFASRILQTLGNVAKSGEMILAAELFQQVVRLPSKPRYIDFGEGDPTGEFILQANKTKQ